jgi:hypothetical protein
VNQDGKPNSKEPPSQGLPSPPCKVQRRTGRVLFALMGLILVCVSFLPLAIINADITVMKHKGFGVNWRFQMRHRVTLWNADQYLEMLHDIGTWQNSDLVRKCPSLHFVLDLPIVPDLPSALIRLALLYPLAMGVAMIALSFAASRGALSLAGMVIAVGWFATVVAASASYAGWYLLPCIVFGVSLAAALRSNSLTVAGISAMPLNVTKCVSNLIIALFMVGVWVYLVPRWQLTANDIWERRDVAASLICAAILWMASLTALVTVFMTRWRRILGGAASAMILAVLAAIVIYCILRVRLYLPGNPISCFETEGMIETFNSLTLRFAAILYIFFWLFGRGLVDACVRPFRIATLPPVTETAN